MLRRVPPQISLWNGKNKLRYFHFGYPNLYSSASLITELSIYLVFSKYPMIDPVFVQSLRHRPRVVEHSFIDWLLNKLSGPQARFESGTWGRGKQLNSALEVARLGAGFPGTCWLSQAASNFRRKKQ